MAVAISFRLAYPLTFAKCHVNVLLLLRHGPFESGITIVVLFISYVLILSRQNTMLEREPNSFQNAHILNGLL